MSHITYLKGKKREVYGLLSFEKTILERIFIDFGDLERNYEDIKHSLKCKFRLKDRDFVELIETLVKFGYLKKIGGKRNLTLKCLK